MKTRSVPIIAVATLLACVCQASGFEVYTVWPFDSTEAVRRQQQTATDLQLPAEISVDLGGGVPMVLKLVPAGRSRLGAPTTESGYEGDEALRSVTFSTPFYMTKYQVTRAQFKALMGSYPADQSNENFTGGGDSFPALVWYEHADTALIPALNLKLPAGMSAHIPDKDEWEHACRAGTQTTWYSGNDEAAMSRIGWYSGNAGGMIHPVGQKGPNPWGLCDMVGNVWTWAHTTTPFQMYAPHYYVKGGGFNEGAFGNGCRTANLQIQPYAKGVRLVVSLPATGTRATPRQHGSALARQQRTVTTLTVYSVSRPSLSSGDVFSILGRLSAQAAPAQAPYVTVGGKALWRSTNVQP